WLRGQRPTRVRGAAKKAGSLLKGRSLCKAKARDRRESRRFGAGAIYNESVPRKSLSGLDLLLSEADRALKTLAAASTASRPNPAGRPVDSPLEESDRRRVAGLMRVNHAGEIAAQALYQGQALTARSAEVREQLRHAADEEGDHLAWCEERLRELDSRPSVLN